MAIIFRVGGHGPINQAFNAYIKNKYILNFKRFFAYEDTLKFKLHGYKPLVMIIHPYIQRTTFNNLIADAEEALGLARAVKWDILPGPTDPKGGWDEEALGEISYIKALKDCQRLTLPSGWHVDRGSETDEEFDVDDETWRHDNLRRQWAESCILRVRQINNTFYFGTGKVEELAYIFAQQPCDYIYINTLLSPIQHKYLEDVFNNVLAVWKRERNNRSAEYYSENPENEEENRERIPTTVEVIDRHRIVLEIFSLRANSKQAQLQVCLARTHYLRNRLSSGTPSRHKQLMNVICNSVASSPQGKEWVSSISMEYIPSGETYQEFERRLVDDALKKMRAELEDIRKCRKLHRVGRKGTGTIAIVGYTNVGKTALLNYLCNTHLTVRDLLFQTLDSSFRRIRLPNGSFAILVDSVGFIQNLPHSLYEAFQATLEEMFEADILLHVRDISHSQSETQKNVVMETLLDIGISKERLEKDVIEVWNKFDLLSPEKLNMLMDNMDHGAILTCAVDGTGCDLLLQIIQERLRIQEMKSKKVFTFDISEAPERLKFLRKNCYLDPNSMVTSEDGKTICVEVMADANTESKYERSFNDKSNNE